MLLLISFFLVDAAVSWNVPLEPRPPFVETLDPATADPAGAISCPGSLPEWSLPMLGDWDPNTATLLEICAKPAYGGRALLPLLNTSYGNTAFCYNSLYDRRNQVLFDSNPIYLQNPGALSNPRLLSYCLRRCFCTSDTSSLPPPPRTIFRVGRLLSPTDTYMIELDRFDDFENPDRHRMQAHTGHNLLLDSGRQTWLMDDAWHLAHFDEPYNIPDYLSSLAWVSMTILHPIHRPVCRGNKLPDFPLPRPLDGEAASNTMLSAYLNHLTVQRICAAPLLGGDDVASAGAYCHRHNPEEWDETPRDERRTSLWFSAEMTPLESWTLAHNYRFAAQIQLYCFQHCRCRHDQRDHEPKVLDGQGIVLRLFDGIGVLGGNGPEVEFLQRIAANSEEAGPEEPYCKESSSQGKGQKCSADVENSAKWKIQRYLIIPGRLKGLDSKQSLCGIPGTEACPEAPWPSAALGPAPGLNPPDVVVPEPLRHHLEPQIPQPAAVLETLETCGSSCLGPASKWCYQDGITSKHDCRCIVVNKWLAMVLNIDPIGIATRCITLAVWKQAATEANNEMLRALGGRAVGSNRAPPEALQWACPCNATYASAACCDSTTGIIWEDSRMRVQDFGL